jgi:hypothetical protein
VARHFTAASSEKIVLSLGALGFAFGPATVAAVVRASSDGASKTVNGVGPSGSLWTFYCPTSNQVTLYNGTGGASSATITLLVSDGWCLIGAGKATGSVAARIHKYVYTTDTWLHADTGALADSGVPATSAAIGAASSTGNVPWNGDIAAVGIWNVVLTDANVESLAHNVTLNNWNQVDGLKGFWTLDQPDVTLTVTDQTGGGANQTSVTGTTIVTDTPNLVPPVPKAPGSFVYDRTNN